MKKHYLFCTKPYFFLCALPSIILLLICAKYNDMVDGDMRLYPLMVCCAIGTVMIILYFFRAIEITKKEVRSIGLFSERDRIKINSETEIRIDVLPKHQLRVSLDGKTDYPGLRFAYEENDENPTLNLYRARAVGSLRTVRGLLSYLGIEKEDIDAAFRCETFNKEYDDFTFFSKLENSQRWVSVKFK